MGWYGLVYNTPSFGWNLYLVFAFPAFFSSIIALCQPFMENYFGRKPLLTGALTTSGTLLLLTLAVPEGKYPNNWPVIACANIGTICVTMCFGVG